MTSAAVERTFDLPGLGARTYRFPTVFHEVELLGAVGTVPAGAARAWLPAGLEPAALPGGGVLVMVTVQHFPRPAEFPGYREAALAVYARGARAGRGFHVLTMPVTSPENLARGPTIFGLPKELADVRISSAGRVRVGEVYLGAELLFRLEVRPRLSLPLRIPVRSRYLQLCGGDPSHVDTRGSARAALAGASFHAGPLLFRRYPAFPERFQPFAGVHVTAAELELHLPARAA
ncbi:MAG TPA: acetoacetate decarboxylase family protein [Myxococcales bacterium]|nr:acetoacetate decarboxylase family protein [Myxococcales bacterium]